MKNTLNAVEKKYLSPGSSTVSMAYNQELSEKYQTRQSVQPTTSGAIGVTRDLVKKYLRAPSAMSAANVALIFDATGSMEPVWNETQEVLGKLLSRLNGIAENPTLISVIAYRNDEKVEILPATTDIVHAEKFIKSISCRDGDSFNTGNESVEVGLRSFLESSAEIAIVVGDASPNDMDVAQELARSGKKVFTVVVNSGGWFYEKTQASFNKLAQITGGESFLMGQVSELLDILSGSVAIATGKTRKLASLLKKEQGYLTKKQKEILMIA